MLAAMTLYYPQWVEPMLGQKRFNETCRGTMPVVFGIINKATSYEEAIRYAIAVGVDSDTIGAIVGSIAEAIWEILDYIKVKVLEYLPKEMIAILKQTPNQKILRFMLRIVNRNS